VGMCPGCTKAKGNHRGPSRDSYKHLGTTVHQVVMADVVVVVCCSSSC
jgi:hypothetical protein